MYDSGISDERLWYRVRNYNSRFPGTLTVEDLKKVIEASGGKCCWCGKENLRGRDLTFEHLSHANDPNTFAVACYSCNASHRAGAKKRSDLPSEVLAHRDKTRHKNWEKENAEAVKAAKRAEYLRNKETRRRYLEANRERILAQKKAFREANKEKIAAYQKEWDSANKERHAAQRKAWREAHPEEVRRRWHEFYSKEENAEIVKAQARTRRAMAKSATSAG